MEMSSSPAEEAIQHRKIAVALFNFTWSLLDKPERTAAEIDSMINAAHASCHHWSRCGTPINQARGHWQISRVYSVLNRAEPALFHARRCLDICRENKIGDFDLAFAYEALARGFAVAGQREECARQLELARQAAADIKEEGDRKLLESDLAGISL